MPQGKRRQSHYGKRQRRDKVTNALWETSVGRTSCTCFWCGLGLPKMCLEDLAMPENDTMNDSIVEISGGESEPPSKRRKWAKGKLQPDDENPETDTIEVDYF